MGVKPGPVRKKLIENKNEMQRKEFKTRFLSLFKPWVWSLVKREKISKLYVSSPKNIQFSVKLTTTYLEETSGANVYIDKEYQGSDDNALCVILGKHEQVSIAKVMIKEKLNQYNSANTFTILDNDGK